MRPFATARRPLASLAASLALLLAAGATFAKPVLFPPLPDGRQETRDERDVAPYLAAWKAAAATREKAAYRASTPNQLAWDARWYDLALMFTPATATVSGTVRMRATVTAGPISTVDLDLWSGIVVDAATSGGAATTFTRATDVLTLNLDRAYATGELVEVTVTYHGAPSSRGYFGFPVVNGRQLIWSLSEAYGARTWWPCKDAPEDKADSVDVHFTVPTGLTTASNGTLVSTVNNGSTVTTTWKERYPIATYLVFIASYPYTVADDWYRPTASDSMLLRFHMFPESVPSATPSNAKVKLMLGAFAQRFGEYPFLAEKYGHAEFTFGGGMEHQTCTSLGTYNESVVAHELGHQWWGDLVTCRDFHHIWLNEGFATYSEALWSEANGGAAALHADMALNRFFGPGTIWVPDASNESRVFDSNLSYNKASWVLHMLRHVLGDATFFQALADYRAQWGYSSATTENFRDACEQTSGRNLHDFFQQWIYGEYYPAYRFAWTSVPAAGGWDVSVTLDQTQTNQLFHMPVDVTIDTGTGSTTFVVDDSLASQTFVLHVTDAPTGVRIDKDNWILKSVETAIANPSFEKPLLLVNGVDWLTYGTEITTAYSDKAFWGNYTIDFWDALAAPVAGYPATLPAPLGHGAVPAEVLGHYRNVVWVGNNFNGDLAVWQDTPVLSYLRVGGNLLLLSRMGDQFLNDPLRSYLGVTWTSTSATLLDCIATRPGLTNVGRIGTQSTCAVFDTTLATAESQLLFRAASGFTPTRGIGAVRVPAAGAGPRPHGGRFAFLSGRPYRWDHTTLKNNVSAVLAQWFLEPANGVGVGGGEVPAHVALEGARPNPSRGATTLRFGLPRAAHARLVLLDVAGRRVRTLVDGDLDAGPHDVAWDGADERGVALPAGLYWARVEAAGETAVRRLVRVR